MRLAEGPVLEVLAFVLAAVAVIVVVQVQAIRKNLRVVISLSIGLVLATALVVGWALTCLSPGWAWRLGTALGAAVAPPDPVAALAVGGRVGLPSRLITIIDGEGLLSPNRPAPASFPVAKPPLAWVLPIYH